MPQELLSPYRALDLTDDRGCLCGKVLADLGAEVIKVEGPPGDPTRKLPPFYGDKPHPEKSLFFWAYNQGKKGITLNLEHPRGRELFLQLVASADWVLESFPPGTMERLGLGYESLKGVNRRTILVSVTPFGQEGPYAHYEATDLVVMAMGGPMYLGGDPDRPPVRISFPQAYFHAAAEAAVGAMIALWAREKTGEGQWVDVSAQESILPATFNAVPWWEFHGVVLKRQGTFRSGLSSGALQRQTWPCRDGYVTFVVVSTATGAKTNRAMVEWMAEEGMADDWLRGIDWDAFDMAAASQEFHQRLEERVGRFFLAHTAEELYEEAMKRRVMLYPVASIPDIARNPQLQARGFWGEMGPGHLTAPGPFIQASLAPLRRGGRAPRLGEHNREIYGRLGLGPRDLAGLKREGVI